MIEDLSDDAGAIEFFGHRAIVSRSTTHIVSAEDQDAADLSVPGKADEVALED